MADGRHFTDYRPRCLSNNTASLSTQPMTSYEHRQFLISNAEKLMAKNREETYQQNMCGPCVEPFNQGTMLPEQTNVVCNAQVCKVAPHDAKGLGQGRIYSETPMTREESEYLARREADNKRLAKGGNCCSSSFDDMQFYPIDGVVAEDSARLAVPGGGMPLSGTSRTK